MAKDLDAHVEEFRTRSLPLRKQLETDPLDRPAGHQAQINR
jgi:hypothetical protein